MLNFHSAFVIYKYKTKTNTTMKNAIITANVGKKGSFMVVTDSSKSACELYAYDKNNSQIFKYSSKSQIISSVAISKSGKYFAALSINAKDGVYTTTLNVFNKKSNKPISTVEENKLIINVSELDYNGFVLTSSNETYYYNAKNNSKTYDGTALTQTAGEITSGSLVSGHTITYSISGTTGDNNKHVIEYSLKLDSNPEFTACVIVAYARAAYRLYKEGQVGCKTVFDIAPAYLSAKSGEELRKEML